MSRSFLVALIDDEASVRKAIGRLLTAAGLTVEAFGSGQEFLDSLARRQPDCVVLDLHMPGLTGLAVQQELARAGVEAPVVIITAFDEPESRVQCLAAGAAAYLLKPLDEGTLLDAIGSCARKSSPPA